MGRPVLIFDRAGLREVDKRAVEDFGLPVLVLMENAGRAVAEAILRRTPTRVLIVCGPGNNGGDGLVAARHLHNAGVQVDTALLAGPERYHDEAGMQLEIVRRMGLSLHPPDDFFQVGAGLAQIAGACDVIVDGLFGTGLGRPVTGRAAEVIATLNASGRPIVAIDIPSGLDCDTGRPLGACVRAAETVSFCGLKVGFARAGAAAYTGTVTVGDIGAPRGLLEQCAKPMGGGVV